MKNRTREERLLFCKKAQAKAKKQKHEEKKHARVFIPAEPVADPEE